jgi:quercetin dioxygenase-like cupin family protein
MPTALRPVPRCLLLVVLAGCAARTPRVAVGPLVSDLDALLAAHPIAAKQEIRADELGRSASASYHLVQVAGSERPHHHRAHDLVVVVLRGDGTLSLGDTRVRMRAGDTAAIARDRPHWFHNDGRTPAVAFVVFTPPLDAPDTVPEEAR